MRWDGHMCSPTRQAFRIRRGHGEGNVHVCRPRFDSFEFFEKRLILFDSFQKSKIATTRTRVTG